MTSAVRAAIAGSVATILVIWAWSLLSDLRARNNLTTGEQWLRAILVSVSVGIAAGAIVWAVTGGE